MREIGVRELKTNLSAALDRVEAGEAIKVTRHGRPVAEIVPAGARRSDDRLRALLADGRIAVPTRSLPSAPPRLAKATRSATEVVLAERDDER